MPHLKLNNLEIQLNMSEKFSLKWNDYLSNWTKSLSELRHDTESADVTLVSNDKIKFAAHKILLSSCSNTFKFILKGNTHANANTLLFLGGISSINLGFILDYIYYGEVNLFQEQLDSFLESAQKLEIESFQKTENVQEQMKKELCHEFNEERRLERMDEKPVVKIQRDTWTHTRDSVQFDVRSLTAEEIEMKTRELYQKEDGSWICMACPYSTTHSIAHIRKHIETHLDGLIYTCPSCYREYSTKNTLQKHISLHHRKSKNQKQSDDSS